MQRFPSGTRCKLYYDTNDAVRVGDYLVSSGGSGYLIEVARQSAKKPGRFNLVCLRCKPEEIPAGAMIHQLYWYRRARKDKSA